MGKDYRRWSQVSNCSLRVIPAGRCSGHCLRRSGEEMRTDFMGSIRVIFCSNCTQPQLWYGVALRVVVACLLMTSCSQKYKADERDKSHLWSDHSQIAVGGRENYFSLSFDSHLSQGTSHVSSTFHSKCLASAEEFTVDEIEVWGFVRESRQSCADSNGGRCQIGESGSLCR